jgi:hypothetical protein
MGPGKNTWRASFRSAGAGIVFAALTLGTGCVSQSDEAAEVETSVTRVGLYGGTLNGLTTNGLTTNGLTTNGLTTNGLTTNGLATTEFRAWFDGSAAEHSDMVMRYVARCALAKGTALTWTHPGTGERFSWPGGLGLAPGWTRGAAPTEAEQQVVSACLAAHTNKYGVQVPLSVQGEDGAGAAIPLAEGERATFDEAEACFFGNLFTGEGIYAGSDRNLSAVESTARGCGLSSQANGQSAECAPMVHVGRCRQSCTLDPTGSYYARCEYNGKVYKPITTRLRSQDVFRCGDGVCQVSESCGISSRYDSCRVDCGTCR